MSYLTRRIALPALLLLTLVGLTGCGSSNPYQGMSDQDLFLMGQTKFDEGEWNDAIRALDRLLVSFGTSEHAPQARLMLADAYFNKGDLLTARSEYQRFLDRFPSQEKAPTAALGICRSLASLSPNPERDQAYTNDAIGICRNVVVDYAGTPESVEAAAISNEMRLKLAEKEYLNAQFYFRRELYDSAIKYYEFVVQLYSETEYAPEALKGIYLANTAIGYDDLAEEARQRLLESYPDSPAAQELRTDGDGGS
jgi:outer membrane protein assembly factor BamD